jgi:N-acetylmuramoyl-L-alanine amidase
MAAIVIVACAAALPISAFAYTDHVVQAGETLSSIADRYGYPVETLMDVNGIEDPSAIREGQVIRIPGDVNDPAPATPAPTAPASPTPSGLTHTVKPGEWLSTIAAIYGVSVEDLAAVNALLDVHLIKEGQVLRVPGPAPAAAPPPQGPAADVTHTVALGEWISTIAADYGVSVEAIAAANGLSNPDAIHEGQLLIIPAGGAPTAPPSRPDVVATHVVLPGETLGQIAARHGVTIQALVDFNGLADADHVVLEQTLRIPPPGAVVEHIEPVATRTAGRIHTVEPGETLAMIADHYGFAVETLVFVNNLENPNIIRTGQAIEIPGTAPATQAPGRRHTVAAGESLGSIAGTYRVPIEAILAANGLENPNLIVAGQVLRIPPAGSLTRLPRSEYERVLTNAAVEFGLQPAFVKAVAWQESGWNQDIVSHANAFGLMQIIPSTAQWALETLIPDAPNWDVSHVDNARMGAAILRNHLDRADWDIDIALAAYYQGFEAIRLHGFFQDTHEYIASIRALIPQFE